MTKSASKIGVVRETENELDVTEYSFFSLSENMFENLVSIPLNQSQ